MDLQNRLVTMITKEGECQIELQQAIAEKDMCVQNPSQQICTLCPKLATKPTKRLKYKQGFGSQVF